jgi:hypothetical protein
MLSPKIFRLCIVSRGFLPSVVTFTPFIVGFAAVDMNDFIVPAERTIALKKLCNNSRLIKHNEGR